MMTTSSTSSVDLSQSTDGGDNASHMLVDSLAQTESATVTSVETPTSTQITQWVYIQTPSKISLSSSTVNKNNSVVVNSVAPMQISSVNVNTSSSQSITLPGNQSVILAHPTSNQINSQQVYIQKPTIQAGVSASGSTARSKNALAYLTMIKPSRQLGTAIASQKYVIAPMPKLTTNRLPTTITTNCVQSKIALMPVSLKNAITKPTTSKHKIFNLKIAGGQMLSESNGTIKVVRDTNKNVQDEVTVTCVNEDTKFSNRKLEFVEDKTYELSIIEDAKMKDDVSFTITVPDEVNKTVTRTFQDVHKFSKHDDKDEVKITTIPSNSEEVQITEIKTHLQKPERRRKSTFSYRKEYDEIIMPSNTNSNTSTLFTKDNCINSPLVDDEVEIKVIKEYANINMGEEFDAKNFLSWEDNIGTLPGSEIKFHINEFGLLEYLKTDEYKNLINKKALKNKNYKSELQEEMRCFECGCYGLPSEFINPKYCSYDCQEAGNKVMKQREIKLKKKSKSWFKKSSNLSLPTKDFKDKDDIPSEEEQSTSNESSQDKFSYPWTCSKKGFSWAKYLEHIKAKAAPVKLFKDPFPYNRNGFRPGMKLEGIDPQHPSYYCLLTVAEVIGYRVRLSFDGFPETYDFWVNADSMDIFPAGWCEKYGHVLHPPPGFLVSAFNWNNYLKLTKSTIAPKHLFANRAGSAICPNGFRVGMKLEAVDRKNTSLICVATVADMMDNRILVHFDSWDDIYDYWADPTSPYIHPVGWCDQNGHRLTPPNGYPNPETFTWEQYLKETKTAAVPVRAFKQKPAHGFKKGMRLECVDKRLPQLIRAATVDEIREYQIRISFDGWPDRYSYWIDSDSHDMHPVGWCQKTGHPLEPPLTPDDVYDFLECPTVGCKGQGHIKGPHYFTHSSPTDCPYSDENINKESNSSDRLLSPDCQLEAVIPVSREPKEKLKAKIGRPPKIPKIESLVTKEWSENQLEMEELQPLKHKYRTLKSPDVLENGYKNAVPLTNGYSNAVTEQIWEKHVKYLRSHVKVHSNPRQWQEDEVIKFINSLPHFQQHTNLFRKHKIDGEALLMLNQKDLVDVLNIKLGPAVKLYNIIVLLRRKALR